jgi:signal transduction histidine kinase
MSISSGTSDLSLLNRAVSVLGAANKPRNDSRHLKRKGENTAYAVNIPTEVEVLLPHRVEEESLILAGQMVYGIAHDVRHYLCCLVANVELMCGTGPHPPDGADFVEEFNEVVQEICFLLDLPMAVAGGRDKHALRKEELGGLVEQAVRRVRCHPIGKTVDISFECPALPRQRINRATMISAIFNLALNACQAAGHHDGKVNIEVTDPGSHLVISVADNGPGLPVSVCDSFLASFGTQRTSGGFGLGLSIAARAAAEHGGSLRIQESRPGRTVLALHIPKAFGD